MTAAVIALGVVVVLLLAERWQQHRRADASQQMLVELVDRLCQRLQAPAAAVLEHDERVRGLHAQEYAPPAVEPEDDNGYWASREQLAELMAKGELSG